MADEKCKNQNEQIDNYVSGATTNYNHILKNVIESYKNKYIYNNEFMSSNVFTDVSSYVKSSNDFNTTEESGSMRIERIIELLKIDENMCENEEVKNTINNSNNNSNEETYQHIIPDYDDNNMDIDTNTMTLDPKILTSEQNKIFNKLYELAISNFNHFINDNITAIEDQQQLEVVLGGPGSGKSFVIKVLLHTLKNKITEIIDNELLKLKGIDINEINSEKIRKCEDIKKVIAICATTGAAAAMMGNGCRTVHGYFCINIKSEMNNLTSINLQNIRMRMYGTHIVIIDELSMMSTTLLGKVSRRLQEIKGNDKAFGGCSIFLFGDFCQLPAVHSESLHHGVINEYDENKEKKNNFQIAGRRLFKRFHINFLGTLKRSETDKTLSEHIHTISDIKNLYPITKEMLKSLKEISIEEMTHHEKFQEAPIAVTSNVERYSLLRPSLIYHSLKNGTRIVYWRKPFQNKYIFKNIDFLYSSNFDELHGFFVQDIECMIGCNQSTTRGVANGTTGKLHSLIWNNNEISNQMHTKINNTPIGEFVEVIIPDFVNIEFSDEIGKYWGKNLTMVENKYVLPLPILMSSSKNMKLKEFKFKQKYKKPITIFYHHFEYEISTSSTVYKMQGRTMEALLLELNRRPKGLKSLDLASYFTALSRVKTYNDLRILPIRDNGNLEYLLSLHQDAKHVRYMSHIVDGYFKDDAENRISKEKIKQMMLEAGKEINKKPREKSTKKNKIPNPLPEINITNIDDNVRIENKSITVVESIPDIRKCFGRSKNDTTRLSFSRVAIDDPILKIIRESLNTVKREEAPFILRTILYENRNIGLLYWKKRDDLLYKETPPDGACGYYALAQAKNYRDHEYLLECRTSFGRNKVFNILTNILQCIEMKSEELGNINISEEGKKTLGRQ